MHLLRQQLFGALIGLSRASESKIILESSGAALMDGLVLAYDPVWDDLDSDTSEELQASVEQTIQTLHAEKALMTPDCAACQYPCGRTADYDMAETLEASDKLRDAKLQLLALLGATAINARKQGLMEQDSINIPQFLSDALFQISCTYEAGQLKELILQAEKLSTQ